MKKYECANPAKNPKCSGTTTTAGGLCRSCGIRAAKAGKAGVSKGPAAGRFRCASGCGEAVEHDGAYCPGCASLMHGDIGGAAPRQTERAGVKRRVVEAGTPPTEAQRATAGAVPLPGSKPRFDAEEAFRARLELIAGDLVEAAVEAAKGSFSLIEAFRQGSMRSHEEILAEMVKDVVLLAIMPH